MLDLNHPLTPYILEASRYEDEIRKRLVALLRAAPGTRDELFREILTGLLQELRRLLHERFDDRPGIARKLDALQAAVQHNRPSEEIWAAFRALDELSEDTFRTGFLPRGDEAQSSL